MRRMIKYVVVASCGAAACGTSEWLPPEGETVRFDPALRPIDGASEATQWLAFPFPADHRRTADGHIDTSTFPNPDFESTVGLYAGYGPQNIGGFGLSSPVYLSFTAPLDTATLPTAVTAFTATTAPLQLIDITATSPEYGQRRALRWEWFDVDGKYVGPNTLAVAPVWGLPLREDTTYALILSREVASLDGAALGVPPLLAYLLGAIERETLDELLEGHAVEHELLEALNAQYEPLRARLALDGIDPQTLAAATVFTTQNITHELQVIHDVIQEDPAPTVDPLGWQDLGGAGIAWETKSFEYNTNGDSVNYHVLEGRYDSPNFVEGERPYATEFDGGTFHWVDGVPTPTEYEHLRFVLTFPADEPPRDGDCYPIVEYSHGTGGSARGLITPEGGRHAARGLATIGLDQPLHGTRWSGSDNGSALVLYSFNFFNPGAARTLFRQSAADTFVLTRLLREGLTVPADKSPTGQPVCFDAERISYFGHSHGGLTGSLAAAYERGIDAWVLSGAGGGIAITVMEREDEYIHARELLESVLLLPEGETLSELHPLVGLIQLLAEITDPINYAPYWNTFAEEPTSVLLTSGQFDEATPYRTAGALAVAAGMPQVLPVEVEVPEFDIAGLTPIAPPKGNNARGKTLGFMQWTLEPGEPEDYANHFVAFHRPDAINATMRFLESTAFEDQTLLERDPDANVK